MTFYPFLCADTKGTGGKYVTVFARTPVFGYLNREVADGAYDRDCSNLAVPAGGGSKPPRPTVGYGVTTRAHRRTLWMVCERKLL